MFEGSLAPYIEIHLSGVRLSSARSGGTFDVLLKQDEVQIVPERLAEAFVTVGEGLCLPGSTIAAAFIPGDQGCSDIDYRHADAASTMAAGKLFGSAKQ